MSSETRRITFTHEELIQAMARQRRDEKKPLPESRIRGARAAPGKDNGEPRVAVVLQTLAGDGQEEIELRPAEVAAALIKFCHLKKIPLPRRASKSIGVDRGYVSLVLQLAEH